MPSRRKKARMNSRIKSKKKSRMKSKMKLKIKSRMKSRMNIRSMRIRETQSRSRGPTDSRAMDTERQPRRKKEESRKLSVSPHLLKLILDVYLGLLQHVRVKGEETVVEKGLTSI